MCDVMFNGMYIGIYFYGGGYVAYSSPYMFRYVYFYSSRTPAN